MRSRFQTVCRALMLRAALPTPCPGSSVGWMRLLVGLLPVVLPAVLGGCVTASAPAPVTNSRAPAEALGSFRVAGDTLEYEGSISKQTVARLLTEPAAQGVHAVVIRSGGGDVEAGLAFGNWVLDHQLDVSVKDYCMSSCANYVFTAGRTRRIPPQAVVIWHGSVEQQNFRGMYGALEEQARLGKLPDDAAQRAGFESRLEQIRRVRMQQVRFFQRAGVDEYVTRLGQEPVNYHAVWTVSLETMARTGMAGVEAEPDYGTPAYMKRALQQAGLSDLPVLVLCLQDGAAIPCAVPVDAQ